MGIITDPGYTLYGDDCLRRYAAGLTPLKLYASFTGIVVKASPPPSTPNAPNQIFLLEQSPSVPCKWSGGNSDFSVRLEINPVIAELWIMYGAAQEAFYSTGSQTAVYFENIYFQTETFILGSAFISPRPLFAGDPSLQGVMALLNIEPDKKTFGEIFPAGSDHAVYKFNRKADKTNILVKVDLSAL